MTVIANSPKSAPICCAQGRHGEVIIAQDGSKPLRWAGGDAATEAGVKAPEEKPGILVDETDNYHIARIDVVKPGAVYYSAPTITLSSDDLDPEKGVACSAKMYLSQASCNEVVVSNGGKYYGSVPNVTLGDSHGKGGEIVATTGLGEDADGITQWKVVAGGTDGTDTASRDKTRYPLISTAPFALTISGNGTYSVSAVNALNAFSARSWNQVFFKTDQVADGASIGGSCADLPAQLAALGYTDKIRYTVSGYTGTTPTVLLIKGSDQYATGGCSVVGGTAFGVRHTDGCSGVASVEVKETGAGFDPDESITITIAPTLNGGSPLIIEGYPAGHPENTESTGRPIRSISIVNAGSGYISSPQLEIISNTGFGAYATCTVKDGKLDTVTLENKGGGYKSDPVVRIVSGGAEASVIARPHLRGKYQCYYRYIDDTTEKMGGPIPSNLSDVNEVDSGEAATSVTWTVAAPTGRAKSVELWRSTGDQALTVYRVATLTPEEGDDAAELTYLDDLTDEELMSPDRDGYEAMPILLPNGELNANRFTPPPEKSSVVRFQDRFWYGVGGDNRNAIYFSEVDEPESVPDVNEIIPQQSGLGSDELTALIPYGSTLMLMQSRHAYSLVFSRQPLLDAQVSPTAYRGCVNQRCWDIHDGILYVMDHGGVYAISQSGSVESLSDAIEDQFQDGISWGSAKWFFLAIDPRTKFLRAFVAHKDDGESGKPTRAFCYSLDSKGWWVESYPQLITGSTQALLSGGEYRRVYAAESGPMLLDDGTADLGRGSITKVAVTDGGAGYKKPPTVTASGGRGARFQATLTDGKVSAIWILSPGSGFSSGQLEISLPDDSSHPAPRRAVASFTATPLAEDTPISPVCRYKSGFLEYKTDSDDSRIGGVQDRSIALSYRPQDFTNDVSLRTYYNGSYAPRANVAERDRGVGFRSDPVDPAARLDIGEEHEGVEGNPGVANALFSGLAIDDTWSTDRSVAVELIGPSRGTQPMVIYKLDVRGAAE